MTPKQNEKTLARTLYFETDQPQSEIAKTLKISTKTLYLWMKEGEWQRLKKAARQAPAVIVDNLYEQLLELNNNILSRPAGNRFPTREEAEISRKLILSIDKIKKQATLSDNIQVMKSFTSYLFAINPQLAQQVIEIADDFIKTKSKDDQHPYEMEYEHELSDDDIKQKLPAPPLTKASQQLDELHDTPSPEESMEIPPADNVEKTLRYREGIEEIDNPDLAPYFSKELRVGNITIRFGRDLTKMTG